ncbi:MAG TPA: hypothetical protein VLE51_03750 [Candidatus Saccharimonadales bacterium]|nr:hypothetical protein [Candidatus Saccharimonadales bacterium]
MADVILAALILTPAVITYIFRSNAALSFLTLAGAFTLITFGSADLKNLTGHLDLRIDSSTLNLILLVLPLFFTLLFARRAFSGKLKLTLHLVTALLTGTLLALISVPLLNASARADFADSWAWANLQKIQTPIVAAGLILSLILIWFAKHPKHDKKHKHK